MRMVTHRRPENEIVETPKGELSYFEWCREEIARINSLGGKTFLKQKDGKCAVWTSQTAVVSDYCPGAYKSRFRK